MKKNERTVGEFSPSKYGQLAKRLAHAKRANPNSVPDRLLPNIAKTTRLFFEGPIQLHIHRSFEDALAKGEDAFACLSSVLPYLKPPVSWVYPKFLPLKKILGDV